MADSQAQQVDRRGLVQTLGMFALVEALRPHQWVKNLFVLGPLVFSKSLVRSSALASSLGVLLVFCAISSAAYLWNDWCDLAADQRHPTKCRRPLASGRISPRSTAKWIILLLGAALMLALQIGPQVLLLALVYLLGNFAYSAVLKQVAVLDAMVIALGYVLRVLAGAAAVGVEASPWILLCTIMLSLLLCFGKRYGELSLWKRRQDVAAGQGCEQCRGEQAADAGSHRAALDGYSLPLLSRLMTISAAGTILSYALYTLAGATVERFGSRGLAGSTLFVIFGVFRYLQLVEQDKPGAHQAEDPARLLLKDRPLLMTCLLWAGYVIALIYAPEYLSWPPS